MVVGMGALANTTPPPDMGSQGHLISTYTFADLWREFVDAVKGWWRGAAYPFGQFPDQNPFTDLEYEDADYPDGGPYVGEPLACYHRRKWAELDPEIKDRAVTCARAFISVELAEDTRKKMQADPDCWLVDYHHGAGTWFRNELRRAVLDKELPTGCWDDYYVCAIEEAVGGPEEVDTSWEATRVRENASRMRSTARLTEELREIMAEDVGEVTPPPPGPPNPPDIPHHRPVA